MTTALLHLCFFASGFAALLYQTAWTREFATVFGTSELAISVVLAGYMAGLAAGAAVACHFGAVSGVLGISSHATVYRRRSRNLAVWDIKSDFHSYFQCS